MPGGEGEGADGLIAVGQQNPGNGTLMQQQPPPASITNDEWLVTSGADVLLGWFLTCLLAPWPQGECLGLPPEPGHETKGDLVADRRRQSRPPTGPWRTPTDLSGG